MKSRTTWQQIINDRLANYGDFLTAKEVADVLGTTVWAIYKKRERQQIPYNFVGPTRLIFLRSELREWAANRS